LGVRHRWRGARQWIRATPPLNAVYRTLVAVVGGGVVVLGILLLPLPGPGWLIVFFGLGLLATEFAWARRLLTYARRQVAAWTRWMGRQSVAVRLVLGAVAVLILAGLAAGYLAWQGVPSWVPGIG
jgi:uncharacterized protein (TIGR02611 family)